jgi:hypothetical protein
MNSKINVGLYAFSGGFDRWKGACGDRAGKRSSENGRRTGFSTNPNLKVFRRPRFNLKPTPSPVRRERAGERATLRAARICFYPKPTKPPPSWPSPAGRGKEQVALFQPATYPLPSGGRGLGRGWLLGLHKFDFTQGHRTTPILAFPRRTGEGTSCCCRNE